MTKEISTDTVDAIMADAKKRQADSGYVGSFEWFVLTSAYEAGRASVKPNKPKEPKL